MVILIAITYTDLDIVSGNAAKSIIESHREDIEEWEGKVRIGDVIICKLDVPLLQSEHIDAMGFDSVLFMSSHRSEKRIVSFTAHAPGNWDGRCELGGKPFSLSVSEPLGMLESLREMNNSERGDVQVVYEATHHGPLLKTPSCFIEFGGPENVLGNKAYAQLLGSAVIGAAMKLSEGAIEFSKVVIGIGGTHYPEKFSRLALEKGYAFSHIMPKYSIINNAGENNPEMVEKAVGASRITPQSAVIDWKSLNSATRAVVIRKLDDLGLENERI